jgi:hypothetical protein
VSAPSAPYFLANAIAWIEQSDWDEPRDTQTVELSSGGVVLLSSMVVHRGVLRQQDSDPFKRKDHVARAAEKGNLEHLKMLLANYSRAELLDSDTLDVVAQRGHVNIWNFIHEPLSESSDGVDVWLARLGVLDGFFLSFFFFVFSAFHEQIIFLDLA